MAATQELGFEPAPEYKVARTMDERRALLAEILALREDILRRRSGAPVDVDAILNEMRGYAD